MPQPEPVVASGSPPPSGPDPALVSASGPAQATQGSSRKSASTIILPRRTVSLIHNNSFSLTKWHDYRLLTYCKCFPSLMFCMLMVPFCRLASIYRFQALLLKSCRSSLSKPVLAARLAVANNQRRASRWKQRRR